MTVGGSQIKRRGAETRGVTCGLRDVDAVSADASRLHSSTSSAALGKVGKADLIRTNGRVLASRPRHIVLCSGRPLKHDS